MIILLRLNLILGCLGFCQVFFTGSAFTYTYRNLKSHQLCAVRDNPQCVSCPQHKVSAGWFTDAQYASPSPLCHVTRCLLWPQLQQRRHQSCCAGSGLRSEHQGEEVLDCQEQVGNITCLNGIRWLMRPPKWNDGLFVGVALIWCLLSELLFDSWRCSTPLMSPSLSPCFVFPLTAGVSPGATRAISWWHATVATSVASPTSPATPSCEEALSSEKDEGRRGRGYTKIHLISTTTTKYKTYRSIYTDVTNI